MPGEVSHKNQTHRILALSFPICTSITHTSNVYTSNALNILPKPSLIVTSS
jgi:hypothetical protein